MSQQKALMGSWDGKKGKKASARAEEDPAWKQKLKHDANNPIPDARGCPLVTRNETEEHPAGTQWGKRHCSSSSSQHSQEKVKKELEHEAEILCAEFYKFQSGGSYTRECL